ncbi:probable disease resistance protein At4g27220 [Eucalyptus grandis]|uniref:probable disease resistance protein At4g27220 n=1 Tax=Eucalyptus grandis TaxID=71139 RepID=UPI00192E889E|nr:probable disease resistance protein At4g27220 [Eucalyptus grandis]
MTSLKRKLEELIRSHQADMNKLKSKWMRIEEQYWSVVQAIREGISFPPEKVAEVEGLSKELEQILPVPGRSSKTSHLVTIEELLGKDTRRKVKEMFYTMLRNEFFILGVYGMGGVGKTAILRTRREGAGLLYGHLNAKKACILILDGLWKPFEVKDVGIPVETGKLKLIVTTRSPDVCRMMLCQKQIKIELLDMEDSWRLFLKKLCFAGELPREVEQIARSLLDRCCGLPLGIIEIATRMRGVKKEREWRDMLGNLEESRMELDVFKRLQLSYLNLGDEQVQQCFLHSMLCSGNLLSEADREYLIESFIEEGLLGGSATRQGLYDQGNDILDKIEGAGLLDPEKGHRYLHPLTRDMALHVVRSTTHMVKAYMGLKEIPEEVFWTDRLEKVFLQGNKIEEMPYNVSPNCPKLTRLSLYDNSTLGDIHESFFRHLKGLAVLDLGRTGITKLPDSISQLESLEALLLQSCFALRFIPYVGKLGSLRKLDLKGCESLEEVPEGMEMLANLRYLALDGTEIETLPEGVSGKLVNLQYLAIRKLRAGEEVKLPKVEELHCSVSNVEMFNACVGSLERNSSQRYRLVMGAPENFSLWCGGRLRGLYSLIVATISLRV